MTALLDISHWPDRVEALVAQIGEPLREGRVVLSCDSTQDMARAMGSGSLVVASRQVSGRGQRGNRWEDTHSEGLAFSVCLPKTSDPSRSIDLANAIVESLDRFAPSRLNVKHPNDVLLDKRKLAGVLIEQSDELAVIGIGINVLQESWPEFLVNRAISLRQAGIEIDRVEVLEIVLPAIIMAWMK